MSNNILQLEGAKLEKKIKRKEVLERQIKVYTKNS